jgi:hypothetical protein
MEVWLWFVVGIAFGTGFGYWWFADSKSQTQLATIEEVPDKSVDKLIQSLPGVVIKIDENYQVLFASNLAINLGLVLDSRIKVSQLIEAAKNCRLDQQSKNLQITISQSLGKSQTTLRSLCYPNKS